MHKHLKWLIALMITVFTLPMMGSAVLADGNNYDTIKDGNYDIEIGALKADADKPSAAEKFMGDKATLTLKDDNIALTVPVVNDERAQIDGMQIEGVEPKVEKGETFKYFTYQLDGLKKIMNAQIQYAVPSMDMEHDVGFRLQLKGLENLPVKEDDTPDDGSNKENSEDEQDTSLELNDGSYTINASFLKADSDDTSTMGSYINESVFLSVKDGKVNATIAVNDDETVTKLQVNGKNSVEKKVEANKRYETFETNFNPENVPSVIDAYVEYQAPYEGGTFEGEADFRIALNADSLEKAKASDKPGFNVSNEDESSDKEEKPDDGSGNDSGSKDNINEDNKDESNGNGDNTNENKNNENGDKTTEPETEVDPSALSEAYEYDYVVKHATEDKASAADRFFKKPATVLHKEGDAYIQLEVTNWEWIKSLSNNGKDVTVVNETEDGSAVVQFKVNGNLSDAITLDMHVEVPKEIAGMAYDMNHSARLFLDMDSKTEVSTDDYELAVSQGSQNNGGNDDADNGSNTSKTDDGEVTNPQTGESTNIWLYALLLIGSVIPLAVKLKRRFV